MKLLKTDSSENPENTRVVQGAASAAKDQHNSHVGVNSTALAAMGLFPWPYGSYVQAKRPRKITGFWIHLTLVWNRVTRKITKFWTDLTDQNHLSVETLAVTHAQNTQIVPKTGSISQKWSHWELPVSTITVSIWVTQRGHLSPLLKETKMFIKEKKQIRKMAHLAALWFTQLPS